MRFARFAECYGVTLVVEEDVAHAQGHLLIVEERVCLEIVLERAEIDVRRAASAYLVVADHQLRVEETCLIERHLYACLLCLAEVGATGPLGDAGVALARCEQSHVDTCLRSRLQGKEHRFGG